MISGKIILKSATKVSLDKRFSEIAKQTPSTPPSRIQQQANVVIPHSGRELFGNKRAIGIAQRLKKRSINYRLGRTAYKPPTRPRVFQRLGFANRRRTGGNNSGANSYLFGGQSGMGVRLGGQGRVGGPRTFHSRTRGYLNNNAISRFTRGNRNRNNNRGGRRNNNNNFNRTNNRGRGRKNFNRGGGRGRNNNNNKNVSKESLDTDLDKYMQQTKLETDSIDMNAV